MQKLFLPPDLVGKTLRRKIRLASAATALFLPLAVLFAAEQDVAVDNMVMTLGPTTYRIPHLEIQGGSLSPAELAQLFEGGETAIDARLSRLSAKRVFIPSLSMETRAGAAFQRGAYRDLVLENVAAGRIGRLRAAGGETTIESSGVRGARYVWGAISSKGIDSRQFAHLALAPSADRDETLKPIVEEETIESATIEDERGALVRIGLVTLSGAKGRALSARLSEWLEKLDLEKRDDSSVSRGLLDAIASFDVASLDARDIVATGKGERAEQPYVVKIGRAAANKIAGATVGALAIEDFSLLSSDGGKISLKSFALRDAQLESLLEGAYLRIAHVEAKGLEADLPDPRSGDESRLKLRLAGASADFSNFRDIAPAKISGRLDRLVIDLAARGEAPSAAQFLALGYRDLELSADVTAEWDERTREAVVAPLRLEGKDMGTATLKATLGNVSGAAFSSAPIVSKAAALAASVKTVDLTLEGGGLIDRILAREALELKIPVEKARADYAKAAAAAISGLTGGGEKSKRVADAVAAHIMKPKRLRLRLVSEKGINALDFLAKKPGEIIEGMEVEAQAEK